MSIRRLGVIGGGTMGQGIMHVAAQCGIPVLFSEVSKEAEERTLAGIAVDLDEEVAKWGHTPKEKDAILAKITPVESYDQFNSVDFIIEAVDESLELKTRIFKKLNEVCRPEILFATNSSTVSVSKLAAESGRPEHFIGVHFQTPVHRRPVMELVRGLETRTETVNLVRQFATEISKTPIEVYEWPGLVTTRMIVPFINEAIYLLMEGVASAEDIDKSMTLGFGMQCGPLQLADSMGLDTVVDQMEHLFHELGDVKYRPCPLIKKMVRAGHLGVKSGKGFFDHSRPEAAKVTQTSFK